MRVCGICRKAPRISDPMGTCTVPPGCDGIRPGHYQACSECCARYAPEGPWAGYVEQFYVGFSYAPDVEQLVRQLQAPDGTLPYAPAGLCAVCRRYAREDDSMEAMRLYPEDAPDRPDLFQRGREECYMSCSECRKKYASAILKRLKMAGIVKTDFPVEAMGPHMLC